MAALEASSDHWGPSPPRSAPGCPATAHQGPKHGERTTLQPLVSRGKHHCVCSSLGRQSVAVRIIARATTGAGQSAQGMTRRLGQELRIMAEEGGSLTCTDAEHSMYCCLRRRSLPSVVPSPGYSTEQTCKKGRAGQRGGRSAWLYPRPGSRYITPDPHFLFLCAHCQLSGKHATWRRCMPCFMLLVGSCYSHPFILGPESWVSMTAFLTYSQGYSTSSFRVPFLPGIILHPRQSIRRPKHFLSFARFFTHLGGVSLGGGRTLVLRRR